MLSDGIKVGTLSHSVLVSLELNASGDRLIRPLAHIFLWPCPSFVNRNWIRPVFGRIRLEAADESLPRSPPRCPPIESAVDEKEKEEDWRIRISPINTHTVGISRFDRVRINIGTIGHDNLLATSINSSDKQGRHRRQCFRCPVKMVLLENADERINAV